MYTHTGNGYETFATFDEAVADARNQARHLLRDANWANMGFTDFAEAAQATVTIESLECGERHEFTWGELAVGSHPLRLEPVLIDALQRIYCACSGAKTGSGVRAREIASEALSAVQRAQDGARK